MVWLLFAFRSWYLASKPGSMRISFQVQRVLILFLPIRVLSRIGRHIGFVLCFFMDFPGAGLISERPCRDSCMAHAQLMMQTMLVSTSAASLASQEPSKRDFTTGILFSLSYSRLCGGPLHLPKHTVFDLNSLRLHGTSA